jgi:hypothetical protein
MRFIGLILVCVLVGFGFGCVDPQVVDYYQEQDPVTGEPRECVVSEDGYTTCVQGDTGDYSVSDFANITEHAILLWREYSGDESFDAACVSVRHYGQTEEEWNDEPTVSARAHNVGAGNYFVNYSSAYIHYVHISHEIWHVILWCAGVPTGAHHGLEDIYDTEESWQDGSWEELLMVQTVFNAGYPRWM